MIPKLETPTDEQTGLPLPILPREVLPRGKPGFEANWHHQWHPEPVVLTSPPSLRSAATLGLRNSRLQLVSPSDHALYHRYFSGPPWPETFQEQFDLTVLAVAGFIPSEALDVRGDSPERVSMKPAQMDILRLITPLQPLTIAQRKRLQTRAANAFKNRRRTARGISEADYTEQFIAEHVEQKAERSAFSLHHVDYGYGSVRGFLRRFVVAQKVEQAQDVEAEEFISVVGTEKERLLGQKLLAHGVEAATDSIGGLYAELRRGGHLHPSAPDTASGLVNRLLGGASAYDGLSRMFKEAFRDQLQT